MKFTLALTRECNLTCSYCYIDKHPQPMSRATARETLDAIYDFVPAGETLDIGFFGGEPLLRFDLLQEIVERAKTHPQRQDHPLVFSVTTNGTLFTPEIGDFFAANDIVFCLSCDGPAAVHDRYRRFADGRGSFARVEATIRQARQQLPAVWVNAVFRPETLAMVPDTVAFLADLEVDRIYLNPDYTARWTPEDCQALPAVFAAVGGQYLERILGGKPQYISLVDSKLAAIIKEGFAPHERCRMGTHEFAISPSGHIFPCERLIGDGGTNAHCIGHIAQGLASVRPCALANAAPGDDSPCPTCPLARYCTNWCGCSNFFSTGRYDTAGAFTCASEKAAITMALEVFQALEHHFGTTVFDQIIAVANPDRTARTSDADGVPCHVLGENNTGHKPTPVKKKEDVDADTYFRI